MSSIPQMSSSRFRHCSSLPTTGSNSGSNLELRPQRYSVLPSLRHQAASIANNSNNNNMVNNSSKIALIPNNRFNTSSSNNSICFAKAPNGHVPASSHRADNNSSNNSNNNISLIGVPARAGRIAARSSGRVSMNAVASSTSGPQRRHSSALTPQVSCQLSPSPVPSASVSQLSSLSLSAASPPIEEPPARHRGQATPPCPSHSPYTPRSTASHNSMISTHSISPSPSVLATSSVGRHQLTPNPRCNSSSGGIGQRLSYASQRARTSNDQQRRAAATNGNGATGTPASSNGHSMIIKNATRRSLHASMSSNSLLASSLACSSSSSLACSSSSSSSSSSSFSSCATPTFGSSKREQPMSSSISVSTSTMKLAQNEYENQHQSEHHQNQQSQHESGQSESAKKKNQQQTAVDQQTMQMMMMSGVQQQLSVRPFRPFKSNGEYLYAMKEDLAEWLSRLYSLDCADLTADNFVAKLESGSVLCRHANNVNAFGRSHLSTLPTLKKSSSSSSSFTHHHLGEMMPAAAVKSRLQEFGKRHQEQDERKNDQDNDTDDSGNDSASLSSHLSSSVLAKSSTSGSLLLLATNAHAQDHPHQEHFSTATATANKVAAKVSKNDINTCRQRSTMHYNGFAIDWRSVVDLVYKANAAPGTFHARDNVSQFIGWCRAIHVHECLLFETNDLVLRKNERQFVLCLLEVARLGFKVGMPTPTIVQLEHEIDAQLERDAASSSPNSKLTTTTTTTNSPTMSDDDDRYSSEELDYGPRAQIITNDLLSLHERVVELLNCCTCPTQFPMVRIEDGKYKIGDKLIIFLRILRNHIMVRVGGGWDTLEHYLDKHDPCRVREKRYHQLANYSLSVMSSPSGHSLHSHPINCHH